MPQAWCTHQESKAAYPMEDSPWLTTCMVPTRPTGHGVISEQHHEHGFDPSVLDIFGRQDQVRYGPSRVLSRWSMFQICASQLSKKHKHQGILLWQTNGPALYTEVVKAR